MRATFASEAHAEVALEAEARDAALSVKEGREWRLLLLEFIAHAARTPSLAAKLQAHERRLTEAIADALEQRLSQHGAPLPLPIDDLAVTVAGLASGLAIQELSDPGCVRDDLLGDVLALLLTADRR
jgi:BetI-type transcriptional repressor, C-terminal